MVSRPAFCVAGCEFNAQLHAISLYIWPRGEPCSATLSTIPELRSDLLSCTWSSIETWQRFWDLCAESVPHELRPKAKSRKAPSPVRNIKRQKLYEINKIEDFSGDHVLVSWVGYRWAARGWTWVL